MWNKDKDNDGNVVLADDTGNRNSASIALQGEVLHLEGLRFGSAMRALPRQVEEVAYSFLHLEDMANAWIMSRGMAAAVARYLRNVKTLHFFVHYLHAQSNDPRRLGLELVMRYCRSLRSFRAAYNTGNPCWRSLDCQIIVDKWIASFIILNRATLRSVWLGGPQTNRILRARTSCRLMDAIDWPVDELSADPPTIGGKKPDLDDDIIDRITVENMPHLRSLSIDLNMSKQEHVQRILSQGFDLTTLHLRGTTLPAIVCLRAEHFQNVQTLTLQLDGRSEMKCIEMLTQMGNALTFMPSVTSFDFSVVRNVWMHLEGGQEPDFTQVRKTMPRPVWRLPSLRRLVLCAELLPVLPEIQAPQLEKIIASDHGRVYYDFVSLLLSCPKLIAIESCSSLCSKDGEVKADDRFLDALRCQVWPQLTSLNVDTVPRLFDVLGKVPTAIELLEYRLSPEHITSTSELVAVIQTQPQLTELNVFNNRFYCTSPPQTTTTTDADLLKRRLPIVSPRPKMRYMRVSSAGKDITPVFRAFSFPNMEQLAITHNNEMESFSALLASCPKLQLLEVAGQIKRWDMNVSHPLRALEIAGLQTALWQDPSLLIGVLRLLPQVQALIFRSGDRVGQRHDDAESPVPQELIRDLMVCAKSGHLQRLCRLWLGDTRLDEHVHRALWESLPQIKDLLFVNGRIKNGEFIHRT